MNGVSKAWLIFVIVLVIVSIASESWIPFAITVGVLLFVILIAALMTRVHRTKPTRITRNYVDDSRFEEPGDNEWIH